MLSLEGCGNLKHSTMDKTALHRDDEHARLPADRTEGGYRRLTELPPGPLPSRRDLLASVYFGMRCVETAALIAAPTALSVVKSLSALGDGRNELALVASGNYPFTLADVSTSPAKRFRALGVAPSLNAVNRDLSTIQRQMQAADLILCSGMDDAVRKLLVGHALSREKRVLDMEPFERSGDAVVSTISRWGTPAVAALLLLGNWLRGRSAEQTPGFNAFRAARRALLRVVGLGSLLIGDHSPLQLEVGPSRGRYPAGDVSLPVDGRAVLLLRNTLQVSSANPDKKILLLAPEPVASGVEHYGKHPASYAARLRAYEATYGALFGRLPSPITSTSK